MPKYKYKCEECEYEFEVRHEISEELQECLECKSDSLKRLPSWEQLNLSKFKKRRRDGDLVKEFIEINREGLSESRESINREDFE